jgi:hypothetical protein
VVDSMRASDSCCGTKMLLHSRKLSAVALAASALGTMSTQISWVPKGRPLTVVE